MDDATKAAVQAAVESTYAKAQAEFNKGLLAVNTAFPDEIHWAQKYWWAVALVAAVVGYYLGGTHPVHVSVG